jgi:hypothetical protein
MASTYLSRTFGSAGNQKTWTWSAWIKRSKLSTNQVMFGNYTAGNIRQYISFNTNNQLFMYGQVSGSDKVQCNTTRVFRDTNAWYHIVVAQDTTQGTGSNRVKFYINGVQETLSFTTTPSQNDDIAINDNGLHLIGAEDNAGNSTFDGLMSHVHFCDGTALAPTVFGSTDSTTGEWKINTSPSFTLGTNGFTVLKDGNTITDQSSNSNNFTLASGTLTQTEDNPSNVFATVNAVIGNNTNGNALQPTLENANTTSVYGSGEWRIAQSTLGASSGKYYSEFKIIEVNGTWYSYIGIYDIDGYAAKISGYPYLSDMANCYGLKDGNGNIHTGGSGTSYGVSYGAGNIIGVAMDLDNNKLYFSKDGVWMNSANPSNGTGGYSITADKTYVFGIQHYATGYFRVSHNYGNGYFQTTAVSSAGTNASGIGIFEYDVPTGYTALSTKGLNL